MKKLDRRDFLSRSGCAVASLAGVANLACSSAYQSSEQQTPNFLFILIDDLGWSDLGCYGSKFYETPNIDRLASQGMRFTAAYAASPVCSPTRASILTGKYPARLQITYVVPSRGPVGKLLPPEVAKGLPIDEVTIAERLKQAGYVTGSIGKWHLGGEPYYPEKHGFDVNVGGTNAGEPQDHFYPGWTRGPGGSTERAVPVEGRPGDYLTDNLSGEAIKFIEANKNKPFFLYLSHYAVHYPFQAKPDVVMKYEKKREPGQAQSTPVYAAMIESMDESIGSIMGQLEKLDLAKRTVVIFFSDNGGLNHPNGPGEVLIATSNAPLREGKGHLYEGGIRVPMIVRWPGVVEASSLCETPVSSQDFYPTLVELAGIADSAHTVDGVSLVPLLKQSGGLQREELYWHFPHYVFRMTPGSAIRQGEYKLIENFEDGRLELYNLRNDLSERNDLAQQLPIKTREMHERLVVWRQEVNAGMPVPNAARAGQLMP